MLGKVVADKGTEEVYGGGDIPAFGYTQRSIQGGPRKGAFSNGLSTISL